MALQILNGGISSFAQIPHFGDTIRKFQDSVTAAEGMTAREYEQILLVSLLLAGH